jgi:FkbM family methyltransferase
MSAKFHSQLGQDKRVIERFGGGRPGYFVEVGASNGVRISNTLALERDYGWRGICIEPVPSEFEQLCRNRPKAFCSNKPLADRSGLTVSFDVWESEKSGTMLSGIAEYINTRLHTLAGKRITMQTETLTEVLDRAGAPAVIEYLSLDTEGSELAILRGVDWSRYRFTLIHLEHNYVEPQRAQMREFLEARGYRRITEMRFDDEYEFVGAGK